MLNMLHATDTFKKLTQLSTQVIGVKPGFRHFSFYNPQAGL